MYITFDEILKNLTSLEYKKVKRFTEVARGNRFIATMAINENGFISFCPKTSGFIKEQKKKALLNQGLISPFKHSFEYKNTKIWLDRKEGNSVEIFFSFLGHTNSVEEEIIIKIPSEEFAFLRQILKIPTGFIKLYLFSLFSAIESDYPWFSFSFNASDTITIKEPSIPVLTS